MGFRTQKIIIIIIIIQRIPTQEKDQYTIEFFTSMINDVIKYSVLNRVSEN